METLEARGSETHSKRLIHFVQPSYRECDVTRGLSDDEKTTAEACMLIGRTACLYSPSEGVLAAPSVCSVSIEQS